MKATHATRRVVSHRYLLPAALALSLVMAMPAKADSVTDWNALAAGPQVLARFGGPPQQSRALAITHIAMHDALNTINPRYRTYNALPAAAAGASPDAAIAAAAHKTLLGLIDALGAPAGTAEAIAAELAARQTAINSINAAYAAAIGADIDAAEAAGIAAGEAASDAVFMPWHMHNGVKWIAIDGAQAPNSPAYNMAPAMKIHQPTPTLSGALTQPQFMGWGSVWVFAVNGPTQFRAPPSTLFDTASPFYAAQYNEVKHHGDLRVRAAYPNSEKTDIARFWPAGGLEWNATMRQVVASRGLDRWQHARLFALATVSAADSLITLFSSKYHYNFWRPVTAIRWADDGNPLTQSDPGWVPFMPTPPYPDYPCGSTSQTGAYTQAMRRFFGTNAISFSRTVTAPAITLPAPMVTLPEKQITRKYNALSIAENEQARARVYEGFHFAEGCYAGLKAGNQVADWVYAHEFRPL